ncbi:YiiX/YebB-like N1pC/P60 family cysteine hydrolase [Neptunomonas antarctica]|uniref:Permuted papain-like amidase enzyme, YaeF/YiiX, C92 family n=1 Tax=Neptunomonas antarctica TaxID=619304 RepID=A0A1N7K5C5_9GAMM|nr:YiiX/YebB-like N1pC/P60 family cysteine hydrolase [Neptunomonas antarctica]SIS56779.1 Permuted papain-like amidase enzyme, YaeF/YiiX, C92 family [Neptunomonas antarctica]
MRAMLENVGSFLADYLSASRGDNAFVATSSPERLASCIRKGDVLLVEGTSRVSTAIKYLTQSTWSHAAIYIGDSIDSTDQPEEARTLIEADIIEGVRAIPLSTYYDQHTRICRPVGLSDEEVDALIHYLISRLGDQYDRKNIFDLARYLLPTPPVPTRWRRTLLQLGSGDPTRAICSSLIAEAFQSIHYPILPSVVLGESVGQRERMLYKRHSSLFTPRDFDVSPYFKVIKPMLETGFDYHSIVCWGDPLLSHVVSPDLPVETDDR